MQKKSPPLRFLPLLFLVVGLTHLPCGGQTGTGLLPGQLILPAKNYTLPLHWLGDSVNGRWDEYAALLIPVKLSGCPKQFYMQFDLGSPYSLFYKNKLQAIQLKYPGAVHLVDTTDYLANYHFKAGTMPIYAKKIIVRPFDSATINWSDKKSMEVIGTLGADLIDDKIVLINYPAKTLYLGETLPGTVGRRAQWSDFIFARRSILFPATINGKNTMLFFDTGSSAFELLTNKETYQSLSAPGANPITYTVQSWQKSLTAHTIATNDSIELGRYRLPLHYVTYIENASDPQIEQMRKLGIGGMTGNKLFLWHTLVLDVKNKKFGLVSNR